MDETELRLVHKGERIPGIVRYETEVSFDGDGPDIIVSSVTHKGKDILKELPEREVEQLQEHIRSLLRQDALDRAEAAWVSNREERGQLWTIKKLVQETIGRGADAEEKWVMYFNETPKCITLNKTNSKKCEKAFGSDNTDEWIGKQIVVYWDADVEFGGEATGGIRLRAPKNQAAPEPEPKEDLPF